MKTFSNLIYEVQNAGRCHRCGGCVAFCTAVNYGALELDEEGWPRYGDAERCIECGICHPICPEVSELDPVINSRVAWSAPMGRVIGSSVVRSTDRQIRSRATDGGAVTGLLVHLMDAGRIDGAIVTRQTGLFQREPWIAHDREELIAAAGFHFDASHGMTLFSDSYSTYAASIHELEPVVREGLRRVAFVGTPCQIKTMRKMEALGVVPSESIKYSLGLFCTGNFAFGPAERRRLEEIGDFRWEAVVRVNVKDTLQVHLNDGAKRRIALDDIDFMKRYACRYCIDYAAEYADIAFGGIGAADGWTTVITRTPLGRAILHDALGSDLETFSYDDNPRYASEALQAVQACSDRKKAAGEAALDRLGANECQQ